MVRCPNCQQLTAEHQYPGGLTQDIQVPSWKWENINKDFVMGVPQTRRQNDIILVVMDRLTEFAHFIPIKFSYSVEDYARTYINEVVILRISLCPSYHIDVLNLLLVFGSFFNGSCVLK